MKNKILKIALVILSLILIATIAFYVNYLRVENAKEKISPTDVIELPELELTEAKQVMTQDEMEAEIAKYKADVSSDNTQEDETNDLNEDDTEKIDIETPPSDVVDFAGLQAMNPDVYAWISVPGTKIEYPILQHAADNTYYLNYNIDGSHGYPGCIYTENVNAKNFSDTNTIIYGHNMKNGTMFSGLHNFKDKDFFNANKQVIIYTPETTYEYEIFAAYTYDDRHLWYSFDFKDEAVYENYLNNIFEMRDMSANIDFDANVTKNDKIITLVTCIGNQPNNRLLVQAVLR